MSNLFSQVLNMSMTGSVVILLVMLARLILKRAPKIYSYALWSVVLFRLLCPVAFTAPVSVLNAFEPVVQEASETTSVVYFIPAEVNQVPDFSFVPAENQSGTERVQAGEAEDTRLDLITVSSYTWITGTAIMILYSIIQYIRLRGKLVGAVVYRGNVYRADYIDTPFVMGVFSPKIYLPSDIPMNERKYIIAHERHHICRCDHIIKLLAYLALSIHWFNPLVWVAFIQAGKDMEMSCDEAVIRKMGSQIRADYSASLLRLATHKKIIAGMPLAFGEGDTKGRVMNMAKWKKPKALVSIVCIVLCAVILVACAVNPIMKETSGTENKKAANGMILNETGEIMGSTPAIAFTHSVSKVQFADLTMELPFSYTSEQKGYGHVDFLLNGDPVAYISLRGVPELKLDMQENNSEEWCKALGLPEAQFDRDSAEFQEEPIAFMIGGSMDGTYLDAWYGNELYPDKMNVHHHLFITDTIVYDICYDMNKITDENAMEFLSTVYIAGNPTVLTVTEQTNTVDGSDIIIDAELVQYCSLKLLLPSGYSFMEQAGTVILTKDSVVVGGIRSWNSSEFQPSDIVELKQEESGVPIGYMSSSSAYGDVEYEVFWDGNPDGLNEQHTFFIDGDVIYDVWYDQNLISVGIAERFLKTVAINADPVIEENPNEQTAFAKCRAVLEAVRKGNYKVVIRQTTGRNESAVSHEQTYTRSGADWLSITNVLPMGADFTGEVEYATTSSRLCVNGKYFGFGGAEWVEIAEPENARIPWLAEFTWDDNIVAYMDTLTDEDGECIMLRVDEQYIDLDAYDPHYFLYFNFDPDGNFVSAQLQVNLFRDNEINITESIASLDAEEINAEIQAEYQRAIG